MREDTMIFFTNPAFREEISELVRNVAQTIIGHGVKAELEAFLKENARIPRSAYPLVKPPIQKS